MKNLKLFETTAEYEEYVDSQDIVMPNISFCMDSHKSSCNNIYTLTINYIDEETGNTVKPATTTTRKNGDTYNYYSPPVTGHTPSIQRVQGNMPCHDLTINVVYSKNTYTLTVSYITNGGITVAPTEYYQLKYQDPYDITPPPYQDYTVSPRYARGAMPAQDRPINFIYLPPSPPVEDL